MSKNYSQKLVDALQECFDCNDWGFTFDPACEKFTSTIKIKNKLKKLEYSIFMNPNSYTVYATPPLKGSPDDAQTTARIMEFVLRINYGLRNGNFEYGMHNGVIRYKLYTDCSNNTIPNDKVIRNCITIPYSMMSVYGDGILKALYSDEPVENIIDQCEKKISSKPTESEEITEDIQTGDDEESLAELLKILVKRYAPDGDDT